MATTVTGSSQHTATRGGQGAAADLGRRRGSEGTRGGQNGRGSHGGGGGRGRDGADGRRPDSYRLGMWVALASVLMMFTALTSAYIVRSGGASDWRPLNVPPFLWVSTGLLVISSFVVQRARNLARQGQTQGARTLLLTTLLLGVGFVGTQFLAWRQMVAQGIYLQSNPHSSFFYVLTGLHALHVVGGIIGLSYISFRMGRLRAGETGNEDAGARRASPVEAVALYWHFMDGLWIYLFLLLFLWR